jgi:hypothetical protein
MRDSVAALRFIDNIALNDRLKTGDDRCDQPQSRCRQERVAIERVAIERVTKERVDDWTAYGETAEL